MRISHELDGKKFNRLTVICDDGTRSKTSRNVLWKCKCECGNITHVSKEHLTKNIIMKA